MNKLKAIQYNCHKATFLVEKRSIQRLTFYERLQLRIHMATCSVCRTYEQQSQLISQMVKQLLYSNKQTHHLNNEAKKHMEELIEEELKK
jgi:hypothetical protein